MLIKHGIVTCGAIQINPTWSEHGHKSFEKIKLIVSGNAESNSEEYRLLNLKCAKFYIYPELHFDR